MSGFPIELPDALVDELARRVAERIGAPAADDGFLDVKGAAKYLSTTEQAIRSMVKRVQLPCRRTPTGRIVFSREELRAWVMSGAE